MKNTNTITTATADILTDITTATATATAEKIISNNQNATTTDIKKQRISAVKMNGEKIPYVVKSYTTEKSGKEFSIQLIDYTTATAKMRLYLWFLLCIKTVTKVIHNRVKAMNCNGANITKFLNALSITSAVYCSYLTHYENATKTTYNHTTTAQPTENNYTIGGSFGNTKHTYNDTTYLTTLINNTFTLFSAFDGFLVDLLTIATTTIDITADNINNILKSTLLAKANIYHHLNIMQKDDKNISIDNVGCDNDDSQTTEKTIAKVAFEKWYNNTVDSLHYDTNTHTIINTTKTFCDTLTEKQLAILTDYAITKSTKKTAENFHISRQGCEKHLKLIRDKFKTKTDFTTKQFLTTHYRLVKYEKYYDDTTMQAYKGIYTIRKEKKSGKRYVSLPHFEKLFNDIPIKTNTPTIKSEWNKITRVNQPTPILPWYVYNNRFTINQNRRFLPPIYISATTADYTKPSYITDVYNNNYITILAYLFDNFTVIQYNNRKDDCNQNHLNLPHNNTFYNYIPTK